MSIKVKLDITETLLIKTKGSMMLTALKKKKGVNDEDAKGCVYCDRGQWHKWFITQPAGWGSIMSCHGVSRQSDGFVLTDPDKVSSNWSRKSTH